MRKRNLLMAAGASLLAVALVAPPAALADPPAPRTLALVGSVTTEKVMAAIQGVTPTLGSYEGSTGGTITTKGGATCANLPRPAGSGSGVDALVAQRQAAVAAGGRASCIDASRSSDDLRNRASVQNQDLVQVPFAIDAVTIATRDDSPLTTNFSTAFLTALYNCTLPAAVQAQYRPLLPQAGSGTRTFFLRKIGVTTPGGGCAVGTPGRFSDVDSTGAPLLESIGSLITDPRNVAPYSVSDYKQQTATGGPAGRVQMRRIDGQLPDQANSGFGLRRLVYNIVPGQFVRTNDPTYAPVFFGPTSTVCARDDLVAGSGFGLVNGPVTIDGVSVTGCGDTTSVVIPGTVTTGLPSATV